MKRERLFYGGAIVLLVAVLILGLWYKQPKTIREITGIAEPDDIHISIMLLDENLNAEQRELTLSAGDDGFDALMAQLDELEFRRPPTNLLRIALPFLPGLDESSKEWEEGDFQHLYITLSTSAQGESWPRGEVSFWVDQWLYRDFGRQLTLPLAMVDGKATGQDLCAQLWEISQPAKS
ncbi:hypothetical protein [uncultured Oscillibacter sp.]|uniref:hypothetical protein n=1 Tax=uncultured Oscillibacter sp. TaxID=876091 RepID=UPI0025EAE7D9|nr:hypothetical protein [uncultured Oscillibacter sp.]